MHLLSFYNLPVTQQNTNLLSTMCSTKHLITDKGPTEVIGRWKEPLMKESTQQSDRVIVPFMTKPLNFQHFPDSEL